MENISFISTIGQAFLQGGVWMWAILAVQIVSIAIIAERIVSLYVLRRPNQTEKVRAYEASIKSGDLDTVLQNAKRIAKSQSIGGVLQAGTQAAVDLGGREEIQAQMDEVLIHENSKLSSRTGLLAMLANTGTLLGLLGTIVGLIQSFGAVSGVDPVKKAALLTEGISMAMNTTAYGLIAAIPALIMYGVLQSRTQKLEDDLNRAALKAFNWLSFKYAYVPKNKVRKRMS